MNTQTVPNILRQCQQYQPDFIIAFQIMYAGNAMADAFDWRHIFAGHDFCAICTISELIEHQPVFSKFLMDQLWISIGQISYSLAV